MINKKVYVINKGGHDYSDARRFGRLVYLSEGIMNRYSVGRMYREFSAILKDSNKDDYILVSGLNIMNHIAGAIFGRLHGRLNILLYRKNTYVERRIIIDELLNNKEEEDSNE
jgi:hypothetical protein